MRVVTFFFAGQVAALVPVLGGLPPVAPHPAFWQSDPSSSVLWPWLVGAACAAIIVFFIWLRVGPRKTLLFFGAALSQVLWLIMRGCVLVLARYRIKLTVEGLEHVPRVGAVLIAARHFHYFYDGYVLVRALPRRLHIIIALDWLQIQSLRLLIELACRLIDWPVILRGVEMKKHTEQGQWVYQPADGRRYLRQVMRNTTRLLRAGEVLVLFPEGHPNIDPHPTPKHTMDAFLPFQSGFVKMAERAQKDGETRVAIIPAGLTYKQVRGHAWQVHLSFGPALFLEDFTSSKALLHTVEERVRALSYTRPPSSVAGYSEEARPL